MDSHHKLDYSYITPFIILGSDLCKGYTCPSHSEEFKKLGIKTEVNLEIEHDEPVAPELEIYLRIPTINNTAPTHDQFIIATDAINQSVHSKKISYVHCRNGHGRSTTVIAAYFIRFHHMTPEEAMSVIKEKRPVVHLEEVQLFALKQFEKGVKQNG